MKIIFLEGENLGEDMVFTPFLHLGEVTIYPSTSEKEMPERVKDADIIVANKLPMCEETLKDAKNLKLVCLTATGINNLDGEYLKKRGIHACNVAGYSTDAVAQHTFAMFFYLWEKLSFYDDYVKYQLTSDRKQVDFDTILQESDVLSIHAPLNSQTENLIDLQALKKMKPTSVLINVARGPIVNQEDLYTALTQNMIAGAGLDVLKQEPMAEDNPLIKIQDSKKLLITPHIAWAPVETRFRCRDEVVKNIEAFLAGEDRNRVY